MSNILRGSLIKTRITTNTFASVGVRQWKLELISGIDMPRSFRSMASCVFGITRKEKRYSVKGRGKLYTSSNVRIISSRVSIGLYNPYIGTGIQFTDYIIPCLYRIIQYDVVVRGQR